MGIRPPSLVLLRPVITTLLVLQTAASAQTPTPTAFFNIQSVPKIPHAPILTSNPTPRAPVPILALQRRQAGTNAQCKLDHHKCKFLPLSSPSFLADSILPGLDINHGNVCCRNDEYCYVAPDASPSCCQIGARCKSNCGASLYQCFDASFSVLASRTTKETDTILCCDRRCPETSFFLCEKEFGGGCCPYGATCVGNGQCVQTSRGSTAETRVNLASGDRGGCCAGDITCSAASETGFCAVATDGAKGGHGLSDGAKAGIGAGVVLGTASLVSSAVWALIVHRRRMKRAIENARLLSATTLAQPPDPRPSRGHSRQHSSRSWSRRGTADSVLRPGPFTTPDLATGEDTDSGAVTRAVPGLPEGPNDITRACEIDSKAMAGATHEAYELDGLEIGRGRRIDMDTESEILGDAFQDRDDSL